MITSKRSIWWSLSERSPLRCYTYIHTHRHNSLRQNSSTYLLFLELCVASYVFYYNIPLSLSLFSFVLLPTHIFHFYPSYFQRNDSLILTAGLFLELLILQFYLCLESTSYNYDFRFVAIWWFFPYNSFFAGEFWFSFFLYDFSRPPSGASVKPLTPQSPTKAPPIFSNKTASVSMIIYVYCYLYVNQIHLPSIQCIIF